MAPYEKPDWLTKHVFIGGTRRNRLFMGASQSRYAVYVNAVGAHIA